MIINELIQHLRSNNLAKKDIRGDMEVDIVTPDSSPETTNVLNTFGGFFSIEECNDRQWSLTTKGNLLNRYLFECVADETAAKLREDNPEQQFRVIFISGRSFFTGKKPGASRYDI